jgi:hypothetical protein
MLHCDGQDSILKGIYKWFKVAWDDVQLDCPEFCAQDGETDASARDRLEAGNCIVKPIRTCYHFPLT